MMLQVSLSPFPGVALVVGHGGVFEGQPACLDIIIGKTFLLDVLCQRLSGRHELVFCEPCLFPGSLERALQLPKVPTGLNPSCVRNPRPACYAVAPESVWSQPLVAAFRVQKQRDVCCKDLQRVSCFETRPGICGTAVHQTVSASAYLFSLLNISRGNDDSRASIISVQHIRLTGMVDQCHFGIDGNPAVVQVVGIASEDRHEPARLVLAIPVQPLLVTREVFFLLLRSEPRVLVLYVRSHCRQRVAHPWNQSWRAHDQEGRLDQHMGSFQDVLSSK